MGRIRDRIGRVRAWIARRRHERGAVLVEAVIVIPILMLLTFGGIEFGLGFSQKGGLESVSRAGARRAATLTDVDDNANANQLGLDAASAVNAALGTTSLPEMNALYVYKVPGDGSTPGYSGGTCGADCMSFSYDTGSKSFVYDGGSWPKANRNACNDTPDRVGVQVEGTFHFLTNLVGTGDVSLTATSVLQLEPTNCHE